MSVVCPVTRIFIQGYGFGMMISIGIAGVISFIALRTGKVSIAGFEFLEEGNFKEWLIKKIRGDD